MRSLKLITVILLIFLYLFFSYARFYHFIGKVDLTSLYTDETSLTLENLQGKGSAKYVALGDSLSAGVGSSTVQETFVYRYALHLSEHYQRVTLVNLAQPGGTTVDVINTQLPKAIIERPDYVTLLIGINDIHNKSSVTEFRKNYQQILTDLLTKTNAHITVITIPYLGSSELVYFPFDIALNLRTNQFNQVISDLVTNIGTNNRVRFVDLYKDTYPLAKNNVNYYASDLFHPSGASYILWGEIINAN